MKMMKINDQEYVNLDLIESIQIHSEFRGERCYFRFHTLHEHDIDYWNGYESKVFDTEKEGIEALERALKSKSQVVSL